MAELKASTSIGGNLVWHGGNLRFNPQGETVRYSGYKVYTEYDKPDPHLDLTEPAVKVAGDSMNGKLKLNARGEALLIDGGFSDGKGDNLGYKDAWMKIGGGAFAWNIKYVGSGTGSNANDLRFESTGDSGTGKYWQMDHDGHFEYNDGSKTYQMLHVGNYAPVLDPVYVNTSGDTMTGPLTVPQLNITTGTLEIAYSGGTSDTLITMGDTMVEGNQFYINNTGGDNVMSFSKGSGVNNFTSKFYGDIVANSHIQGNYISGERIYTDKGRASGYFYNDSGTRTAYAGGDFFIQPSAETTYIYSPAILLGNTTGTTVQLRGSTLTANNWSYSANGDFTTTAKSRFDGAVEFNTGDGFRLKRTSASVTGDDVVDFTMDDNGLFISMNNDDDGDTGNIIYRYRANNAWVNTLAVTTSGMTFKGNTMYHAGNLSTTLDGRYVNKTGDTMTGRLTLPTLTSTVATGTAPFTVASSTKVNNLNADRLDSLNSTQFIRSDATDTMTGILTIQKATEYPLVLDGGTRNASIGIQFNGDSANAQKGYIIGDHINTNSKGSNYSFHFGSTEAKTSLILDGTGSIWVGDNEVIHEGNVNSKIDGRFVNVSGDTMTGALNVNNKITSNNEIKGTRLISTQPSGTAPFTVASTTRVSNLNADLLDGLHASQFLRNDQDNDYTGQLKFPDGYTVNRSIFFNSSAKVQYILLVENAAGNDIVGTISTSRTTGRVQSSEIDIVVSSGSATAPVGGTLTTRQVLDNNDKFELVTLTYNSKSYVAVKFSSDSTESYMSTDNIGKFTGKVVSTGIELFTIDTGMSNVVSFNKRNRVDFQTSILTHNHNEIFSAGSYTTLDNRYDARYNARYVNVTGDTMSGALNVNNKITSNNEIKGTRLISTVANGTAPFTVTSTTKVNNLNADLLDGRTSEDFVLASNAYQSDVDTTFNQSSFSFSPSGNLPSNNYYSVTTQGNAKTSGAVVGQHALHYQSGESYTRGFNNSWSEWRRQIDHLNYSDILGGVYVNASGDSMTGGLTISKTPSGNTDAPLTLSTVGGGGSGDWTKGTAIRINGYAPSIDLHDLSAAQIGSPIKIANDGNILYTGIWDDTATGNNSGYTQILTELSASKFDYKGKEVFTANSYSTLDNRYINNTTDSMSGRFTANGLSSSFAQTNGTNFNSAALELEPSAVTHNGGVTSIAMGVSTSDNYGWMINAFRSGTTALSNKFSITHHNNNSGGVEKLSIDSTGNMTVSGYGRFNGGVYVDGTGSANLAVYNGNITHSVTSTATHNKYNLWSGDTNYAIGMTNAFSFGEVTAHATTFTMNTDDQGWVFKKASSVSGDAAMSVSGKGDVTVKGKVTVGHNTDSSDDGCTMEYNTTTKSMDFIFG